MGDTRIDGSKPYVPPECDEETGVCGAVKKDEPQVSKADPQVSHPGDDWYPPMLPQEKPAHFAQIAKNMSTPKPPADSELRASYEKMTDPELEKEVNTLAKRLSGGNQYSGADLDTQRFHAAEAVAKERADKAHVKQEEVEGTEHFFPYFDEAAHRGENFTLMHVSTEWTLEHAGTSGSVMHGQHTWHPGAVDISVAGDGAAAGIDEGIHNVDGSKGFHASGGATMVGVEGTVHKQGLGSVTFGLSAGDSVEVSAGLKDEGDKTLGCVRIGAGIVTVGVCIPVTN
jgi:hypothetical protein